MHGELVFERKRTFGIRCERGSSAQRKSIGERKGQANRMRNGEVRLSGGGGGSSTFNRGDSHRRRQIAIVQELRDAAGND